MDDGGSYHPSGGPDLLGDFEAPNLTVSRDTPPTASPPGSSILALPPSSYPRLAQFRSPKTPVVHRKPPGIKLHAYMRSALMDKETGGQTWGEESYPSGLSSFATLRPYRTPLESLTEEAPGEIHVPPSSSPPEFSSPASPGSSSPLSDSSPMHDKLVSKSHCSGLSPETSPLREGENDPAISRPSTDSESNFPFHRDEFSNRLYALLFQAKNLKDEVGDEMSTSTAVQATQDANLHVSTALFANLSVPEPEDASRTSSRSEESPMEIESDGPTFASPSPERIPRISKRRRETQDHDLTPNAMASSGYRIIKRAESYAAQCQSSNDSFARKKQKICELSTPPHMHSFRSASLRRAESLRSTDDDMIPTEPATPTNYIHPCRPPHPPVPIIAPPDQHVSTFPLNPEAAAKLRLQRLVEREAAGRERDGLHIKPQAPRLVMESGDWEEMLTIHELPEEAIGHGTSNFDQDKWDDILGIGGALRSRVVEWILKVLPVYPHFTRPQIRSPAPPASPASFSTSTSTTSSRSASLISTSTNQTIEYTSPLGVPDLLDQLATSPETRFHAAYMFLRYFFLVMGDSPQSPISRRHAITGTLAESGEADDVWELVIWDIAIGCMSLSVKFHRDCLEPLVPVLSHEFQALAPHRPSHQDLENAQRDVLEAFSYQLGVTPQAFMDDLWLALSSLRLLLNFSGAWSNVRQQAWGILFDSVLEPDILQFPVSLLTAAAIVEGTITTLVLKYETEARWCGEVAQRGRYRTKPKDIPMYIVDRRSELRNKRIRRAEREAEGVIQDIQAALTIKDADMKWCRAWLSL